MQLACRISSLPLSRQRPAQDALERVRVNGLDEIRSEPRLVGQARPAPPEVPAEVADLLVERATARSAKQWAESDRLRDLIASHGFTVVDTATGQELTS